MVVDLKPYKRVSDPVHGTIELARLEADIVSSKAFQRLHNVKQLGLAHYIFPAANYSRFAHSIGACHNAQRLLAAIAKNTQKKIPPEKVQLIRLAALVHDLGHYPFSHAFEHEIEEFYASAKLANSASMAGSSDQVYDHEKMGEHVLAMDPEIASILKQSGVKATDVSSSFHKHRNNPLAPILSSDLDCDRLDYLRRTAHHSGLPYGNVDINYIIDQATTDTAGHFCFGRKAIRAADHLLVSRYFDYLQVPFHKSVVALEWSLKVVIRDLLNRGKIKCNAEEMRQKVCEGAWPIFDDNVILHEARSMAKDIEDHSKRHDHDYGVLQHILSILHRKPAKLIGSYEAVSPAGSPPTVDAGSIESLIKEFRERHDICDLALHVWKPKDFSLIKASTRGAEAAMLLNDLSPDEPEYYEPVRIDVPGQDAKPITQFEQALMNQIHDFRYRAVRVYALTNDNKKFEKLMQDKLVPILQENGMQSP